MTQRAHHHDVREFAQAAGHTPSLRALSLYMKLVREEYAETMEAWYALVNADFPGRMTPARPAGWHRESVTDLLDGLADLIWVAYGAMMAAGVDPDEVWKEVARANMDKIDGATGTLVKREDGKVVKPEGWKPPDHTKVTHAVIKRALSRGELLGDGEGWALPTHERL